MADYTPAYKRSAIWEGGYQKNRHDRGNYNSRGQLVGTNWGIAAPVYEAYLGHPPSTAEMRAMRKSVAKQIFKQRFWDRMKGDQIRDQYVAEILFDGIMNHGVKWGSVLMQRCLGVTADGIIGPKTLAAINHHEARELYHAYKMRRVQFYIDIVRRRPSQIVFLKGWLRRILSFRDY